MQLHRSGCPAATDGLDGFRESRILRGGLGGGHPHFRPHAGDLRITGLSRAWRIGAGLSPQGGSPRHRVLVPVGHLGPRQLQDRSAGRSHARPAAWSRAPSSDLPKAASRWPGSGTSPAWPGSARNTASLDGRGAIPAASGNKSPSRRRIHGGDPCVPLPPGPPMPPLGTAAVRGPAPAWAGVRTNQRQRPSLWSKRQDDGRNTACE